MLQKWIPQADILAHINIKLFITHGGMFGTQEGLHRGVPMLFVPFFGDQMRNGLKATRAGYARTLFFQDLTKTSFIENINEILRNRSYTDNVKKSSAIFRDNKIDPLDEAVFWIEYVVRNKGAPHLKSVSRFIPWYKYLLLDVLALVFIVLLLICLVIVKTIKFLNAFVCTDSKGKTKLKIK